MSSHKWTVVEFGGDDGGVEAVPMAWLTTKDGQVRIYLYELF